MILCFNSVLPEELRGARRPKDGGLRWSVLRAPACGGSSERGHSGDHAHDVGLLHDQEVLAVELHFRAGPLTEQHAVAGLEIDRDQLAVLVAPTRADRDDLAFG